MEFMPDPSYTPLQGDLIYRRDEYSFDFLPKNPLFRSVGGTTICLGTLQIEVDPHDYMLRSVWGYHPHTSWISSELPLIASTRGGIKVELDAPLAEGDARDVNRTAKWNTIYDSKSGWICVFRDASFALHTGIEFAENVVAGLKDGLLFSLWLKPIILPNKPKQ